MATHAEMQEERNAAVSAMETLRKKWEGRASGTGTPEEFKTFDDAKDDFDRLSKDLDKFEGTESRMNLASATAARMGESRGRKVKDEPLGEPRTATTDSGGDERRGFRDLKTGRELRAVGPGGRFADAYRDDTPEVSIGTVVKGIVTGGEFENRGVVLGNQSAGGYLLSGPIVARFQDLARAKMVFSQAGATSIEMPGAEMTIGTLDTDPTVVWTGAELGTITESAPTFGAVRFVAQTCGVYVVVSEEWMQDATNAESIITETLSAALAVGIESKMFDGSGSGEIMGLANVANVNSLASGGVWDFDEVSQSLDDIWSNDGEATAVIISDRTRGEWDRKKDGQGMWMEASPAVRALKLLSTTAISDTDGGGSDETTIYQGDFTKYVIGWRNHVTVGASRDAAWQTHGVAIKVVARVDAFPVIPNHFSKLTGVTSG